MQSDQASVQVRIDRKTKQQAQKVFRQLGMNFSTGITIYLRQVAAEQTIPFSFHSPLIPNYRTRQALLQSQREYDSGQGITFSNPQDALKFVEVL